MKSDPKIDIIFMPIILALACERLDNDASFSTHPDSVPFTRCKVAIKLSVGFNWLISLQLELELELELESPTWNGSSDEFKNE